MDVRAFLAIPVPDATRQYLADVARGLRPAVPDARFVAQEQLHLTLHFFEALDKAQIAAVREAVDAATRVVAPYSIVIGRGGVFPDIRRARVLWLGVPVGEDETVRLAAACGSALAARGLPVDPRPFRAHLTIARFREAGPPGVGRALERLSPVETDPFPVDGLVLFRSELSPEGPIHTPLERFALRGEGGVA